MRSLKVLWRFSVPQRVRSDRRRAIGGDHEFSHGNLVETGQKRLN